MNKFFKSIAKEFDFNKITGAFIAISLIVFLVGLIWLIIIGISLKEILEMSANYITVCSCSIAILQLIAFMKDLRHKEDRKRKEAAFDIANRYADLTSSFTFVENVILQKIVSNGFKNQKDSVHWFNSLEYKKFTYQVLQSDSELKKYSEIINSNKEMFDYRFIEYMAQICDLWDLTCFKELRQDQKERIFNSKFHMEIGQILNTLEYLALSINQKVSEDEALFETLANSFIRFVNVVYPMICEVNFDEEIYFTNIIKLYTHWVDKREKNKRLKKQLLNEYELAIKNITENSSPLI